MHLLERFWISITYVVAFLTLSPVEGPGSDGQSPLRTPSNVIGQETLRGPIFKPPGGRLTGPDANFTCNYSAMKGWSSCSTLDNRQCWLRNNSTGAEFNISTNYEIDDEQHTPTGVTRFYTLNLVNGTYNADGMDFAEGKFFNGMYPGPWIQACWGDTVNITVNNQLKTNGTSVHWHGIRQLKTMHMDGVNGVTQCPIAPGDSFTYVWKALQYGSSWYHSHYSVQYADGAVGPMTLHGPSSENWDEPKSPLLMTDWGHNSAFDAIQNPIGLVKPSILLNGTGNIKLYNTANKNTSEIPAPFTLNFDPPAPGRRAKRYLLRLINTSFDSTFVFSIDNHTLEIIESDFVPIHGYKNKSVLVGIGQRYHVIVEATNPRGHEDNFNGNYWIRTYKADCFQFINPPGNAKKKSDATLGYEKTGILQYGNSSEKPNTVGWIVPDEVSLHCSDETYKSLVPIVPWTVNFPPVNNKIGKVGEEFSVHGFNPDGKTIFPLARFSIGGDDFAPLQVDYGNPTFMHLNYTGKWNPLWVVIPENYKETDWIYMVIKGFGGSNGAHPIHLHGHDFAILSQVEQAVFPNKLNLKWDNPPRRDVVLLPTNGYVVIAFKTDNPGTWLMHCHIADHASFGLGLQILERQKAAADIWPSLEKSHALQTAQAGCNNWNEWWGNCTNWWHGKESSCPLGAEGFSPDSGI